MILLLQRFGQQGDCPGAAPKAVGPVHTHCANARDRWQLHRISSDIRRSIVCGGIADIIDKPNLLHSCADLGDVERCGVVSTFAGVASHGHDSCPVGSCMCAMHPLIALLLRCSAEWSRRRQHTAWDSIGRPAVLTIALIIACRRSYRHDSCVQQSYTRRHVARTSQEIQVKLKPS